ncbi:ATP-dependent helicase [Polaromonas sp. C04]|uniref:UvrD-helicase domain-containing protein n=1 Tax=Polaromonas sp. C04 TaxID=1945857 RepID=UPI0009D06556|nr:ATP-dependent helicase [Polaromonas sp. C04]OOG57990.1 hypothetical protein B0E49_03875 [Polaromonas sp. C04]
MTAPTPIVLSAESRKIVITKARRVEVQACAGSGKTTTAGARIEYLLTTGGVTPEQILVLTFSIDAQSHFESRLRERGINGVRVSTCHAFGLEVMRRHWRLLGFDREPTVAKAGQATEMLTTVIADWRRELKRKAKKEVKNGDSKGRAARKGRAMANRKSKFDDRIAWLERIAKPKRLGSLASLLSLASVSRTPLAELLRESDACTRLLQGRLKWAEKLCARYEKRQLQTGKIDFDSMPRLGAVALASPGAEIPRYRHLIVDEYQDCSPQQVHLVAALARRIPNLMVFGDRLQVIYGFGGARYTPLAKLLDGVQRLKLSTSYRLTQQTAALAGAIVAPLDGTPIATRTVGRKPRLIVNENSAQQTQTAVRHIRALLTNGVNPSRIAVLARLNAVLHPIMKTLRAAGVGAQQSGVSAHQADLLHVLWLIAQVERRAEEGEEISERTLRHRLTVETTDDKWRKLAREINAITVRNLESRYSQCAAAYLRWRGGINADKPLRNYLNEFEPLCRKTDTARAMKRQVLALGSGTPITFSTVHRAKGREWDYVFVVGVTDGLWPIYHCKTEAQLEEERRLLYVAVTRARTWVRLYHAPVPHARTRQRFVAQSRFLSEAIGGDTLEVIKGNAIR